MLRVRDFGHFCPEGEVGPVGSTPFSAQMPFKLRAHLIPAVFIAQYG